MVQAWHTHGADRAAHGATTSAALTVPLTGGVARGGDGGLLEHGRAAARELGGAREDHKVTARMTAAPMVGSMVAVPGRRWRLGQWRSMAAGRGLATR